jgi:hypothetical protein
MKLNRYRLRHLIKEELLNIFEGEQMSYPYDHPKYGQQFIRPHDHITDPPKPFPEAMVDIPTAIEIVTMAIYNVSSDLNEYTYEYRSEVTFQLEELMSLLKHVGPRPYNHMEIVNDLIGIFREGAHPYVNDVIENILELWDIPH